MTDDTVLIADKINDFQHLTNVVWEHSKQMKININIIKILFMTIGREPFWKWKQKFSGNAILIFDNLKKGRVDKFN